MGKKHRKPNEKVCVWLSRHKPEPEQIESLKDYSIVQFGGHIKYENADDIIGDIQIKLGFIKPDLVMAVLPETILADLAKKISPVPVIRGIMNFSGDNAKWSGRWVRVVNIRINTEEWSPE